MIQNRRAFIIGIRSFSLSKKEIFFLKKYKPWGVILFSRNIKDIRQTYKLTSKIRKIFKDKKYPILIDEEGGRVNRIKNIIDTSLFTAEFFGKLFIKDKNKFKNIFNVYVNQISHVLHKIGVNINTVPMLDVRRINSNNIIGDRSYSSKTKIVSDIGNLCINKFHNNNIGTVMKHIPGHGLAKVDSHKKTPIVVENLKRLEKIDFRSFKDKKTFICMTAHILYQKIDNINVATHSKKVINLIRKKIKFKNIIITDDISMKALNKSIKINTISSFEAGCNIVLHCNAKYSEMLIVAKNSPLLNKFVIKKTSQLYEILS